MPAKESFADYLQEGIRWPESSVADPVSREIPSMRSSRLPSKAQYLSSKMGRPVFCESGLEATFGQALDQLPEVLWYQEQPTPVDYEFRGQTHYYTPDFVVAFVNGSATLVEVKINGYEFALDRNMAKWAAAIQYCKNRGLGFFVGNNRVSLTAALNWPVDDGLDRALLQRLSDSPIGWADLKSIQARQGKRNTEIAVAALRLGLVMHGSSRSLRLASADEHKETLEITGFFGPVNERSGAGGHPMSDQPRAFSRSVAATSVAMPSYGASVGKNTGKTWTAAEEDQLLQMHRSKRTIESMAVQLGRRPRGIRMRLQHLGRKT